MALFFFDFLQGGRRWPDSGGVEFDTTEQAYLECIGAAQEMWGDLLTQREDPRRCSFEILDAQRRLLFTIPFTEVLDACRRPARSYHDRYQEALAVGRRVRQAQDEFRRELAAVKDSLADARALLATPL